MLGRQANEAIQVVRFSVGEQEFALDVMSVAEVLTPRDIRPVPGQPEFIDGVVELRGEYLPVIDMRRRFEQSHSKPVPKFIIVSCQNRRLAIIVDRIGEVAWLPHESMQQTPMKHELGGTKSVMALVQIDDAMLVLLDAEHLLSESEIAQLPDVSVTP